MLGLRIEPVLEGLGSSLISEMVSLGSIQLWSKQFGEVTEVLQLHLPHYLEWKASHGASLQSLMCSLRDSIEGYGKLH